MITRLNFAFRAISERIAYHVARAVKIAVHVALWAVTIGMALAIVAVLIRAADAGSSWLQFHAPHLDGQPGSFVNMVELLFLMEGGLVAFFCAIWLCMLAARILRKVRRA